MTGWDGAVARLMLVLLAFVLGTRIAEVYGTISSPWLPTIFGMCGVVLAMLATMPPDHRR